MRASPIAPLFIALLLSRLLQGISVERSRLVRREAEPNVGDHRDVSAAHLQPAAVLERPGLQPQASPMLPTSLLQHWSSSLPMMSLASLEETHSEANVAASADSTVPAAVPATVMGATTTAAAASRITAYVDDASAAAEIAVATTTVDATVAAAAAVAAATNAAQVRAALASGATTTLLGAGAATAVLGAGGAATNVAMAVTTTIALPASGATTTMDVATAAGTTIEAEKEEGVLSNMEHGAAMLAGVATVVAIVAVAFACWWRHRGSRSDSSRQVGTTRSGNYKRTLMGQRSGDEQGKRLSVGDPASSGGERSGGVVAKGSGSYRDRRSKTPPSRSASVEVGQEDSNGSPMVAGTESGGAVTPPVTPSPSATPSRSRRGAARTPAAAQRAQDTGDDF
mmetsp:Transcript_53970/g.141199  ORF Transcript_53970/g.141199 Transcript_53970/m.141199 type:complete len:398 (-) Transcript_53970:98-1291(-)